MRKGNTNSWKIIIKIKIYRLEITAIGLMKLQGMLRNARVAAQMCYKYVYMCACMLLIVLTRA